MTNILENAVYINCDASNGEKVLYFNWRTICIRINKWKKC